MLNFKFILPMRRANLKKSPLSIHHDNYLSMKIIYTSHFNLRAQTNSRVRICVIVCTCRCTAHVLHTKEIYIMIYEAHTNGKPFYTSFCRSKYNNYAGLELTKLTPTKPNPNLKRSKSKWHQIYEMIQYLIKQNPTLSIY